MDATVAGLIERLGLTPLPVEGTLFASTYRSAAELPGGGPVGTSMVGLLAVDPPSRSRFHRLAHDEVWHFHGGDPLRLVLLHADGSDEDVVLGDPRGGHAVQHVVPAGTWQAAELAPGGAWALFGCTMAPGFTDGCFEGGAVGRLVASHPARRPEIERLALADDEAHAMPEGFAT